MDICTLDTDLFRRINGLAGKSEALDAVGIFLASALIYVMVAAVILIAWYRFRQSLVGRARRVAARDITLMLRAAIASLLAVAGNFLFSLAYFRERPFIALEGVNRLIGAPLTPKSLPSDHTSMAFAIAVTVVLLHPRLGAALLLAALAVAFGRVYVGVHYPSDVLAGMFVGFLAAVAVRHAGKRLKDIRFVGHELKALARARRRR